MSDERGGHKSLQQHRAQEDKGPSYQLGQLNLRRNT